MDHSVDMVGHHDPRMERVTLTLEVAQGVGDQVRDGRLPQPAVTVAGVEVMIHALRVPVEQLFLLLPRERAILREGLFDDGFAFALQPQKDFSWQRPRKPEGDEITGALAFEVWERAA